jgi:hypothetical protein
MRCTTIFLPLETESKATRAAREARAGEEDILNWLEMHISTDRAIRLVDDTHM